MPQFVVFHFTVVRYGQSVLWLLGDFLFSTRDVSESLLVSSGNIGYAKMRCVVVCADNLSVTEMITSTRFRWLGRVSHVLAHRLLFCAAAPADQAWINKKKR